MHRQLSLITLWVLVACDTGSHLSQGRQAIVNGTPDTNPAHQAVVALQIDSAEGRALCSGTLIAPRVVLTAAHCLMLTPDPANYSVGFGDATGPAMQLVSVEEIRIHPGFQGAGSGDDIGLVRLADDAPAGITPIPALPKAQGLTFADVGASLEFTGFGEDASKKAGTKLHLSLPIGVVCEDDTCTLPGGECLRNTVGVVETSGGPCSGDSGGPGFVTRAGVEYVGTVNSVGDTTCSQFGCSTTVSDFEEFIQIFVSGTGKAQGVKCADPIECLSGFCASSVCCDQACDQGICSACSVAAGAQVDGTCAFTSTPCDDGLRCTVNDVCVQGACHGTPLACPADACRQASSCDTKTGACRPAAPKTDGTSCDDGDPCTDGDACHQGTCAGAARQCPGADACHAAACDPKTGQCGLANLPDTTTCDDGQACTHDDHCVAGACAGTPLTCSASDECHQAGTCDSKTGSCSNPSKADGTSCSAGTCQSGTCTTPPAQKSGCGQSGAPMPVLGLLLTMALWSRRRSLTVNH